MRETFWLIPTAALVIAVLAGIALVEIDLRFGIDLGKDWPLLFGVGAEAARGTLTAIATAMATVAGVVFSVTIVALSLAASSYSPRVLRTFMHDRATQVVFGVFVGVFAYCLVVLRTVRGGEPGEAFVPSLAVFGALVLALAGAWVLVYFIHHVALIIQAPTILDRIAAETRAAIDHMFPEELGEGEEEAQSGLDQVTAARWRQVPAQRSGYLVSVDHEGLLSFARRHGTVVRMELGIGEFAIESRPLLALAVGESDVSDGSDDDVAETLDSLIVLGTERTIGQDPAFGVQQIVGVAARALSSGINDPGTATLCIDQLSTVFVRLAKRRMPSGLRAEDGEPRIIAKVASFEALVELAFEPLLRYAIDEPVAANSLATALRAIEGEAPPCRKRPLRRYLEQLHRPSA